MSYSLWYTLISSGYSSNACWVTEWMKWQRLLFIWNKPTEAIWTSQVALVVKIACQCRRHKRHGFDPWVRKTPWRRAWQLPPVFLSRESHGQRTLAGCYPWDCKELDTTEATLPAHRQLRQYVQTEVILLFWYKLISLSVGGSSSHRTCHAQSGWG